MMSCFLLPDGVKEMHRGVVRTSEIPQMVHGLLWSQLRKMVLYYPILSFGTPSGCGTIFLPRVCSVNVTAATVR